MTESSLTAGDYLPEHVKTQWGLTYTQFSQPSWNILLRAMARARLIDGNAAIREIEIGKLFELPVRGGGNGIGLDLKFQTLPFSRLDLNDQEQADIVAFIKALTDTISIRAPQQLPRHPREPLTSRIVSGTY